MRDAPPAHGWGEQESSHPTTQPHSIAKRTALIMGIIGLAVLLLTDYRVFLIR